jgi:hypothetical protein
MSVTFTQPQKVGISQNMWILTLRFLYRMELRYSQILAGCPFNLILSLKIRDLGVLR